jgi:tRNA wybutosine-synthesizing protein 1
MRDQEKDAVGRDGPASGSAAADGGAVTEDGPVGGGGNDGDDGPDHGDDPVQVSEPDYHMEGHTACQTCGWTKNAVKGEGKCYKYAFYGIESHRCVQMTPVVTCNERCVFCWRDHEGHAWEVDAEWDDPDAVAEASVALQRKLLGGYKGNDDVTEEMFEQAMEPRHVAISLDGEPTLYPYLPELIEAFHDRDITTFLVSNGTDPAMLADCEPTQLYVSVDAADRATFDDVVRALDDDAWGRLMETLDVLADHPSRTVIRTTLMQGWNMDDPEAYAALFRRADVDFVELKAYMHVGHSRGRLDRDAMPEHEDVLAFARDVRDAMPDHDELKQVPRSHVAMLARDADTWVPKLKDGSDFWRRDPLAPDAKK